jgi:hypothetical protein
MHDSRACDCCRSKFGDEVTYHHQRVDVLSLSGASPDALLMRSPEASAYGQDEPLAVFEVKCKTPFYLQTSGMSNVVVHNPFALTDSTILHLRVSDHSKPGMCNTQYAIRNTQYAIRCPFWKSSTHSIRWWHKGNPDCTGNSPMQMISCLSSGLSYGSDVAGLQQQWQDRIISVTDDWYIHLQLRTYGV